MIAISDFRYGTHPAPSPWPAMVRERGGPGVDGAKPCPRSRAKGRAPDGTKDFPPEGGPKGRAADGGRQAQTQARDRDAKELHEVGEQIAELAARINAAESRMLTLIAEFDRRGGWKNGGFSSCAEWLAWRTGSKIGPAREKVRTARALENLPQTAAALREGSISYTKVRALTRVATPEREAELLEFARAGSAAKLEQTVRMWRKLSRDEELTAEQARHRSRAFSVFVDGDGMYVVKGRLEPEAGAVLMRAVEAASDALFQREGAGGAGNAGTGGHEDGAASEGATMSAGRDDARPKPKQRRADAVGLLAERALAAGFGAAADGDADRGIETAGGPKTPSGCETPTTPETPLAPKTTPAPETGSGSETGLMPEAPSASDTQSTGEGRPSPNGERPSLNGKPPIPPRATSGTRAERFQVMVHCDAKTLAAKGEPGRSDLDGIRVSAETSRRMACDAAVVAMVHAKDGSALSVGRRTRTIPPHIRRALEERDRGCRFPGCGCRFTEAHHVKHWADGGETSLGNTLLLCRRHHRAVHEGRVRVSVNRDGTVLFVTPKGRMLVDAPGRPAPGAARVPEVPLAHSGALREGATAGPGTLRGEVESGTLRRESHPVMSNGAALYRDSAIPWAIEAAAREAMEESL